MSRLIFLGILIALYLVMDGYLYSIIKSMFIGKWQSYTYIAISLFWILGIVRLIFFFQDFAGIRPVWVNLLIGLIFTIFVTKLLLVGMFLVYDTGRILTGLARWVGNGTGLISIENNYVPGRRTAISSILTGVAAVPFLGFLFGITKGKYYYDIQQLELVFDDLPKEWDGLKIVQISDIHSGSYDSVAQVQKGVDMVNALQPDLIFFTGDLVNSDKDEINPYLDVFSGLQAQIGKFSITGNHDYYGNRGQNEQQRKEYWQDFMQKHKIMGFDILMNENRRLERNGSGIRIVGVENWGRGPFPKIGDLDAAMTGVDDNDFTLLLSHDPTHWEEKTIPHKKKVHLTMSGHTHGMQFGIAALGLKWSPIKWRYDKWAGLYEETGQYLYVNRGFGFLGFPGRVGMWPEITEVTLRSS